MRTPVLALLVLACVLLPGVAPVRWLSQLPLIAHALAFPVLSALLLLILGMLLRRAGWALAGVALLLLPQGWPALSDGGELTVVSFNTQDSLSGAELAGLIDAHDPDLLVLPEARVTDPPAGYAQVQSPEAEGVAPTVLLIHERLGPFAEVSAPNVTWGAVAVELADGTVLAGVHPSPPVPGQMGSWRRDLAHIGQWARDHDRLVLAGDFNATLRHGPMAALDLVHGDWCGGTWPAAVPPPLASPIDHVLVSPDIGAGECRTQRVGTSDHRAVIAHVG
ncbi:hypothetical protein CGUA_01220 [Corynebacterium guangdongense]|nr:hypothetical protein CGUA_01220 [Corynebacterium guangdongense]